MSTRPLLVFVSFALACADLTAPSTDSTVAAGSTARPVAIEPAAQVAPAAPQRAPTVQDLPRPRKNVERITASQILIAHQGAKRAQAGVQRTKEQAKRRAEAVLQRVQKGEDFGALARAESDDPTAKEHSGNLGTFDRYSMPPALSQAAFALEPGQVSSVVESDFGFHIIKRTQ
jgi:parvulin-like peptidyl-prolyl isomerase